MCGEQFLTLFFSLWLQTTRQDNSTSRESDHQDSLYTQALPLSERQIFHILYFYSIHSVTRSRCGISLFESSIDDPSPRHRRSSEMWEMLLSRYKRCAVIKKSVRCLRFA